jgi:hypothetical protein
MAVECAEVVVLVSLVGWLALRLADDRLSTAGVLVDVLRVGELMGREVDSGGSL